MGPYLDRRDLFDLFGLQCPCDFDGSDYRCLHSTTHERRGRDPSPCDSPRSRDFWNYGSNIGEEG